MRIVLGLIGLVFFFSSSSFCQHSNLKTEAINSRCVLSIQCGDNAYDELLPSIGENLAEMGFQIDYSFHLNENPTLKQRNIEEASKAIDDLEMQYWINFVSVFNSLKNYYVWVVIISEIRGPLSMYEMGDDYYLKRANSLEELYKKLNKSVLKTKKQK